MNERLGFKGLGSSSPTKTPARVRIPRVIEHRGVSSGFKVKRPEFRPSLRILSL